MLKSFRFEGLGHWYFVLFLLDFFPEWRIFYFLAFYPSYRRSLQPWKENIQHFKTWKFFTFSNLLVIRKADPNLGTQINADPQTLFFYIIFFSLDQRARSSLLSGVDLGVAVGLEQSPVHPHLDLPPPLSTNRRTTQASDIFLHPGTCLLLLILNFIHYFYFSSLNFVVFCRK